MLTLWWLRWPARCKSSAYQANHNSISKLMQAMYPRSSLVRLPPRGLGWQFDGRSKRGASAMPRAPSADPPPKLNNNQSTHQNGSEKQQTILNTAQTTKKQPQSDSIQPPSVPIPARRFLAAPNSGRSIDRATRPAGSHFSQLTTAQPPAQTAQQTTAPGQTSWCGVKPS